MILFSVELKLYFLLLFIAESSYQKWKDAHVSQKKNHSMFCGDMHLSLHLLKQSLVFLVTKPAPLCWPTSNNAILGERPK